jgi:uncharacterized membrane protein
MSEQSNDPHDGAAPQEEETIQSLAEIHDRHQREVGIVQKLANRVTDTLGRPMAVVMALALVICWIAWNALASEIGITALDRFPFPGLELFAAVSALLVTLVILTTQRHEQDVNRRRDQLTLHMAVLTEKKIAKAIALLEELRRDSSQVPTRDDREASEMAKPANPQDSLDQIEGSSLDE